MPQDSSLYQETIQLGTADRPFNLDAYIEGDRSWITERQGPEDTSNLGRRQGSSPSVTDQMNYHQSPRKKAVLVPRTKHPLYDPISKRVLQPGESIPGPGFPPDPFALREHEAVINEFTDINRNEKEFIIRWDAFVLPRMISSNHGMKKAIIEFVRDDVEWMMERKSRLTEFGMHGTALLLKGMITLDCWRACSDILRNAQVERETGQGNKGKEKEQICDEQDDVKQVWKNIRGRRDCVCGDPPLPSEALFCTKDGCKFRFFHLQCMGFDTGNRPNRWICFQCAETEDEKP